MADGLYTRGLQQFATSNIDWENDTIKVIFLSTSHTFDFTGDNYLSDISGDRASGTTDLTLSNASANIDTGNTRVEFDADNPSDSNITASTDKFALYKDTGNASTSPLICGIEFTEGTLSPVDGTLQITVNAEGFFSIATS